MIISWTAPNKNGGTPITGYTVEYRETSSTDWISTKVKGISHTSVIKGLKESHSYTFRVAAENKVGVGPFSESSNDKSTYGKISLKNIFMTISAGNYVKRLTTGKNEKGVFLTCPCHKIYRVEAVGLKSSNYT